MIKAPAIPGENPFCTRRIRPGALEYLFPPETSWEKILDRLKNARGWGEIIGPHGSGKSTFLADLIPRLHAEGWQTERIDLHNGQRRLPVSLRQIPEVDDPFLLIVDGYEQLGSLSRFHLKRFCRRRGWGLIVTAHQPTGLPELFTCTASVELAKQVVKALLEQNENLITSQEIADRYGRCAGNLREMLFDLYDLFEQRRKL